MERTDVVTTSTRSCRRLFICAQEWKSRQEICCGTSTTHATRTYYNYTYSPQSQDSYPTRQLFGIKFILSNDPSGNDPRTTRRRSKDSIGQTKTTSFCLCVGSNHSGRYYRARSCLTTSGDPNETYPYSKSCACAESDTVTENRAPGENGRYSTTTTGYPTINACAHSSTIDPSPYYPAPHSNTRYPSHSRSHLFLIINASSYSNHSYYTSASTSTAQSSLVCGT